MKKRWQGFTEPGINWEENEGNFPLAECNKLSGKCFSHTPLGLGLRVVLILRAQCCLSVTFLLSAI